MPKSRIFSLEISLDLPASRATERNSRLERPRAVSDDLYIVYNVNRFQACRFTAGSRADRPVRRGRAKVHEDLVATLSARRSRTAEDLGCRPVVEGLLMGAPGLRQRRAAPARRGSRRRSRSPTCSLAVRAVDAAAEVTDSPASCPGRVIESRAEGRDEARYRA